MGIYHRLALNFPKLKFELRVAHFKDTPEEYIKKTVIRSLVLSVFFTIASFLVLKKANMPLFLLIFIFVVFFFLFFQYFMIVIKGNIKKRQRDIDKEILFAGRYLLVKLHSGRPLLNALIEASKSYGVASKYFQEIVDNVNAGTPIEDALESAINFSPSDKFRRILFQISNALKLGTDVVGPLESVLQDITTEQELEIKKYGKKLNSIVIFYLLFAVVTPSLGMTLFVVISGFLNFPVSSREFFVVLFFVSCIQLVFISVFKSIRPMVNI